MSPSLESKSTVPVQIHTCAMPLCWVFGPTKKVNLFCGKRRTLLVLANLFFLLRRLHLHTKSLSRDWWSSLLISSLHQSPDCCIGIEIVKLLLSGRQHQILFSYYYLTDFEATFADKTEHILRHTFICNTVSQSLDFILPLLLLFLYLSICSQGNSILKPLKCKPYFSVKLVINGTDRK